MRGVDNQLYQKYWTSSGGWSQLIPLGGGLISGVAATAWDGNRRDVFARGGDGSTYSNSYQSPSWVGWGRLGGSATSGPGATSSGAGRLEVVTRAGDTIVINAYASAWSGWASLGRAPLF